MIIEENKVSMDPTKLEGIMHWPVLQTVKQVRSFLGFSNFYQKFVRHYSEIAKPLNNLTRKNLIWNWTPDCEEAFVKLKEEFTKSSIFLIPDSAKPFIIESDASK